MVNDFSRAAKRMVEDFVVSRGISDSRVIDAMISVPRHLFVEDALRGLAYGDKAIPIGDGQSISQPYIVARMTELLMLNGDETVLEIGGGSGYQSAILSRLAARVYSVERISGFVSRARKVLYSAGCHNVFLKCDDGTLGWSDKAPFGAILVAASAPSVPDELLSQLEDGGRLVIPVGTMENHKLMRYIRMGDSYTKEYVDDCRFVPLIGEKGWKMEEIDA